MATLVTGGTGFVGVNIVKVLARAGHQVVSLDLNGPDRLVEDFVRDQAPRVTFAVGDILDRAAVDRLGVDHSIDKIVHAAVYTVNRVELEIRRSRDVVDINIGGTTNILELARTLKVNRYIYVSSGAVYGAAGMGDQTLNEDISPAPLNLYGITKYTSELLTQRYGELHEISTATTRLSTPYGPMERVTGHRAVMSVFYDWTGQVARGDTIRTEDLDQGRDYTYVTDIADGIRAVLDAPALPHPIYNVTAGAWVKFSEILDELTRISPYTQTVVAAGSGSQPQVAGPSRGPLSGHRLLQDLNWTPRYSLRAGLEEYLQWRRDAPFLD